MSDPDEARALLSQTLDWALGYLESVRDLPVLARATPGEVEAALPSSPPSAPETIEAILDDVGRILLPAVTHWNHPRFFGWFAVTGSAPGIAGELLSAAFNVNAMVWRSCPAATELELVAARWVAQLTGLPAWFGMINDTASTSTLHALVAARHAAAPEVRARGMAGSPLAMYASEEAHSSVDKAVLTLGMGLDSLRKIPTDDEFRMDPGALDRAMADDVSDGIRPAAVVATVGTTSTTSVDPVPAIEEVCRRYGAWLHVDASYAGVAAAVPELRWAIAGIERADSVVVNPHKWLFVPIDCSVLFLRRPSAVREAFSVVADYLQTDEDAPNLMDYGVALGRRFRALKLWIVLRSMGTDRIAATLREHVRLANLLASWIQEDAGFELLVPVPFSVVNFRAVRQGASEEELDTMNARLVDAVNESGEAFLTTTRIRGRLAIHAAIGHLETTEDDVRALWKLLRERAGG
ncbi:MAG: pyridoxal phosphate-dependent decarboxylase family protein [Actinomycetota bacterium]